MFVCVGAYVHVCVHVYIGGGKGGGGGGARGLKPPPQNDITPKLSFLEWG